MPEITDKQTAVLDAAKAWGREYGYGDDVPTAKFDLYEAVLELLMEEGRNA